MAVAPGAPEEQADSGDEERQRRHRRVHAALGAPALQLGLWTYICREKLCLAKEKFAFI